MARINACLLAVTAIIVGAHGPGARAATQITPTTIEFRPGQHAAIVRLANPGDEPASFEIDTFVWSQGTDADQEEPTDDLLASPPSTTVPAGGSQVVRLLLRRRDPAHELAYRLHIAELPSPGLPMRARIVFQINSSLPVFVAPASAATPGRLRWRLVRGTDGSMALLGRNEGERYVHVRELQAATSTGRRLALRLRGYTPYVLPGVERRWSIADAGGGALGQIDLRGSTDAGSFEQVLTESE